MIRDFKLCSKNPEELRQEWHKKFIRNLALYNTKKSSKLILIHLYQSNFFILNNLMWHLLGEILMPVSVFLEWM
jgi:hypothetical protein